MASVMTTPHIMSAAPAMRMMVNMPSDPLRPFSLISLAQPADAIRAREPRVGADA